MEDTPARKRRQFTGETFSGLHVMGLMYVGFQKVDPSMDLKMPRGDAYRKALNLLGKK